jgi:hypothetical protein
MPKLKETEKIVNRLKSALFSAWLMFHKRNNIHLRSQSSLLYFTTPHWVSNCKVLWTALPLRHLYTGAVENKTLHFGLWHRGISESDQCRQESDQFYKIVYLIGDHEGEGQTESGKNALEKCITLRWNMTVQYLLLLDLRGHPRSSLYTKLP